MSDFEVGSAFVTIEPDFDRFVADLSSGLYAATRGLKLDIPIAADTAPMLVDISAAVSAAKGMGVSIAVAADTGPAMAGVVAARDVVAAKLAADPLQLRLFADPAGMAAGLAEADAMGDTFSTKEFDARLGFKVDYSSLVRALSEARTSVGAAAITSVLRGGGPYSADSSVISAISQAHTTAGARTLAEQAGIDIGAADAARATSAAGAGGGRGGRGGIPPWLAAVGGVFAGRGLLGGGGGGGGGFNPLRDILGLSTPHLAMTGVGLASAVGGGLMGGGALALGGLGVMGVGMGTDLTGLGQAAGDIKTTYTALGQVKAAQQQVTQAQLAYNQAAQQSGPASRQAQTALANLQSAQAAVTTAQQNLNITLQGFSPVAQGAVLAAAQTATQFRNLFNAATGAAESVGAQIINQAIKTGESFLPTIGSYALRNMGIMQAQLQPFFAWLRNPGAQGGLGIFTNLESIFTKNLPTSIHMLEQGFEVLAKVIDIAAQYTGGFVGVLNTFFTKWNDPSNFAALQGHIANVIGDFRILESFLKSGAQLIGGFLKVDAGTGQAILQNLTGAMDRLRAWMDTATGNQALHTMLEAHKAQTDALLTTLENLAGTVGPSVIGLLTTISSASIPLINALGSGLAPVLETLATDLGPVVNALVSGLVPVIQALSPALLPVISGLGTGLITAIGGLSAALVPLIASLGPALGQALPAVGQLIGNLARALGPAAAAILPPLVTLIGLIAGSLAPVLPPLGVAIGNLVTVLAPLIVQFAQLPVSLLASFVGTLTNLLTVLTPIVAVLSQMAGALLKIPALGPMIADALTLYLLLTKVSAFKGVGSALGIATVKDKAGNVVSPGVGSKAMALGTVGALGGGELANILGVKGGGATALTLGGAGLGLYPLISPLLTQLQKLPGAAATATSAAISALKPLGAAFSSIGSTVGTLAIKIAGALFDSFLTLVAAISPSTAAMLNFDAAADANPIGAIVLAAVALGAALYELVTHWQAVVNFLSGPWGAAVIVVGAGMASLVFGPIALLAGAAALIVLHWGGVVTFFTKTLPDALSDVGRFFESIGKDIVGGITKGLSDAWGGVTKWVKDHTVGKDGIVGMFKSILHIFSPSTVMASEVGGPIVAGVTQGMQSEAGGAITTAKQISQQIVAAFGSLANTGKTAQAVNALAGIFTSLATMFSQMKTLAAESGTITLDLSVIKGAMQTFGDDMMPIAGGIVSAVGYLGSGNLSLTNQLKTLSNIFSELASIFGNTASAATGASKVTAPAMRHIADAVTTMASEMEPIALGVSSSVGYLSGTGNFGLAGQLKTLGTVFGDLETLFSSAAAAAAQSTKVGRPAMNAIVGTLTTMSNSMMQIANNISSSVGYLSGTGNFGLAGQVKTLVNMMNDLGQLFGALAKAAAAVKALPAPGGMGPFAYGSLSGIVGSLGQMATAMGPVVDALNKMQAALQTLTYIKGVNAQLANLTSLFGALSNVFRSFASTVAAAGSVTPANLKLIANAVGGVVSAVAQLPTQISMVTPQVISAFSKMGTTVANWIKTTLDPTFASQGASLVTSVVTGANAALPNAATQMAGIGAQLAQAMINGIQTKQKSLDVALTHLVGSGVTAAGGAGAPSVLASAPGSVAGVPLTFAPVFRTTINGADLSSPAAVKKAVSQGLSDFSDELLTLIGANRVGGTK